MKCLFPAPLGSLWNAELDVRGCVGEIIAKNPGCPVKVLVGVSHNRVAQMKSFDYAWAGECHAVAMGIQDNEQASKLESQGVISAVKHDGTTCINISSTVTKGDGARAARQVFLFRTRRTMTHGSMWPWTPDPVRAT